MKAGCHPKEVIAALSEDLLAHYTGKPLIDKYDVYQHLMDYWAETMQDDCYLIAADGWKAETYRIIEKDKKGKEKDKGWTCDLVPKSLIVARYFASEQEAITKLEAELESITARITELEEEHGGEEGAFSELDKVNKANVTARLKEIKGDKEAKDEAAVLNEWLKLSHRGSRPQEAAQGSRGSDLDAKAYAKYPKLTEAEIKTLVVDDKWLAALDAAIHGEMDRISQALTQRVKELAERYETPMPQMVSRVTDLRRQGEPPSGKNGLLMEVKPGYKQTEVGMIPQDWDVMPVRDLVRQGPKNGYSARSRDNASGTATLSLAATSSGRLVLNDATVKHLEDPIPAGSPLFLETGDVLVQRSNTAELVGTTAIFDGPLATFVYPDLMMRLRFKEPTTGQWFWRYANSGSGRSFFRSAAAGSTGSMPKISGEKLREMPVPVPPLAEQEAVTDGVARCGCSHRVLRTPRHQETQRQARRYAGIAHRQETPAGI